MNTVKSKEENKMTNYMITVNHGAIASKETERTFFVEANSKQEAYQMSKKNLMFFGNDEYEYIVEIEEA